MAKNSQTAHRRTPNQEVPQHPKGTLIVIGGNENKEGHRPILTELAKRAGSGKLVVATLASEEPEPQWQEYSRIFRDLGVKHLVQLDVRRREELVAQSHEEILESASVVFFAGGDQMKITSKFGGTALCDSLRHMYEAGATIAGTSSGASVMSDVMMTSGEPDKSSEVGVSLQLAPGLGLISGVIIDQHFAERGRIGRLTGAVAQNPRYLGIGIDEDTALEFDSDRSFLVFGSGCVYVVDGRRVSYTNSAEDRQQMLSVFGLSLHVLSAGDKFDLSTRQPETGPADRVEQELALHR